MCGRYATTDCHQLRRACRHFAGNREAKHCQRVSAARASSPGVHYAEFSPQRLFRQELLEEPSGIRFCKPLHCRTEALRTSPWRSITHVAGKPHRSTRARVPRFEHLMSGRAPSPSHASSDVLLSPDAHSLQLGPRSRPLHFVDHSVNSKCWLLVDVDRPTTKLAVSGILTFDEVPLLQLTLSMASSLQRSKLTEKKKMTQGWVVNGESPR